MAAVPASGSRSQSISCRREHYNYFRDYDPAIGRYIESDPIGLKGGLSTYGYVMGQPLRYFDPSGLAAEMCSRPVQIPLVPGQHCFVRFNGDNNDTMSYDRGGVHPDPKPGNASCTPSVSSPVK